MMQFANQSGPVRRSVDDDSDWRVIGVVIAVYDREKQQWLVFSRPFVVSDPRAVRYMNHAVDEIRAKKLGE